MAIEIERKFLVKSDNWKSLGEKKFYTQGYLLIDKEKTIRVRIVNDKAFITVKGPAVGISRNEFEYQIPVADAEIMLDRLCEKPLIKKYRSKIEIDKITWEVDEFIDENKGLILAEVELKSEDQIIDLPDWIGEEVSGNKRYNNSYLVKHPFSKWESNDK